MSKQQVSIFMGGTGANTASDARTNLGVVAVSGDTMTGNLNVAATLITQNVIPNANITYDLGSSEARFKDLWLSNSTIYLGEASISSNGGALVVPAMETTSGMNLEAEIAVVYAQANSAYDAANNRVLKAGDTMTGLLNVANNLVVTGDVGIGTASPSGKLHISGDDGAIYIDRTNGNPFVYFGVNGDFANTAAIYGATDGLRFYTGTATPERMRLTSAGFVGIGTSSPNTGLHVYEASISATARLQNVNTSGYTELIFQSATKVSSIFQNSGGYTEYGGANSFNIYAASGSKIAFHPGASANRVVFDTNGNVGIGTTSPRGLLDVVGGVAYFNRGTKDFVVNPNYSNYNTHVQLQADAGMQLRLAANGDVDRVTIDTNGYVGIGSTSPQQPFVLVDSTGRGIEMGPSGGVGSGAFLQAYTRGSNVYNPFTYYATAHTWYYGSGNSLTRLIDITSDGYIGIGTTAPNNKLDIRGSFDLHAPNSTTNPTTFGFYHFFIQTSSYNYAHLKTNIPTGTSSTGYGMFLIEATGYTYGAADTIKSMWGMHNWNGGVYSLAVQNLGQWALAQTAYVSSDGFVVLVLYTAIGSYYHGVRLDYIDINTNYAVHYTHPPRILDVGYSDSTSGVF